MTSKSTLLEANKIILTYGDEAEEIVAQKLWDARQAHEESDIKKLLMLIEAIKEVRKLRNKTR